MTPGAWNGDLGSTPSGETVNLPVIRIGTCKPQNESYMGVIGGGVKA